MDPRPTSRPRARPSRPPARLAPRRRLHPHRRLARTPHLARPIAAIVALVATAAFSSPQPTAAQEQTGRLTPELYFEWEEVRPFLLAGGMGPQISPDGGQVLYERRHIDKMKDRWVSELHIVGADGERARRLTDGGGAVWAPDGGRIAFVRADGDGAPQIFVRWMDAEGAETQVSHLTHGPGGLTWSPDGETLAFSMMVPSEPEWTVTIPGRPEGAEWTVEPKVVTRPNYRRDYVGYTDGGYRHIFVLPASGGTPRQLTDGDWNHGVPVWSADGSEILFSALREDDADYRFRESEIYAVSVSSGAIRQLTTRAGSDHSPVPSPDGRLVAYLGHDETDDAYYADNIYIMNVDGSGAREIATEHDRDPSGLRWAADGSGVYYNAPDGGAENMYFAQLDGPVRQITEGEHYLTVYSMAAGGMAAGVLSSAHEPGDVVVFDVAAGGEISKITDVNGDILAGVELGEVEDVWYESSDGLEIQGWIVKPPGFDPAKKYPLMLAIHGGPHGRYGFGTPYMWYEWQLEAASGYVVLYTNPRGSSGYGSEFGNEIENAYPGMDYDDLMAGVDVVLERGYIDEQNMFVYGCSGGGVLTAWVVGHTDRFAGASSECPVTNWLSFVGTTDGLGWYNNFENLPWEDPSEHLRRSPLMYVGNVTTPTLLITGEGDLRTPMGQTEEYYQALQMLKVPTAMVRLQDEWHAYFYRPTNTIRTWMYRMDWFRKYSREARPVS
ncbi:MAG: S9 family peptidase [Gemmatimonadetes bacterium]|nr:S9 family peptidase [Gemmatimonadota bacterium]